MQATFVSVGQSIDYTPGAAVAAGEVIVQGELVGIATRAIAANALGALAVAGIFDCAKASGAITAGALLYWDNTNNVATTTSSGNKLLGKSIAAAASDDTTVRVLLAP